MKKNFTEHYNKEFRAFALSKIFESSDKSTHIHILTREGELKQFSDMLKFFNDKVEKKMCRYERKKITIQS